MSVSIHEHEAVVAERDALRRQLAEAQTKNHWHKDNLSSIKFSLREIQREFDRRQISLALTRCVEQVEGYLADSEKLTALSALVEKSKECMALRSEVERLQNRWRQAFDTGIEHQEDAKQLRQQLAEKDAEIERLYKVIDANWISHKQIVISQLLVKQLREATEGLLRLCEIIGAPEGEVLDKARHAIATPTDTAAIEAMIAKAGEVMRERCATATGRIHTISALPAITMDDLKGGA